MQKAPCKWHPGYSLPHPTTSSILLAPHQGLDVWLVSSAPEDLPSLAQESRKPLCISQALARFFAPPKEGFSLFILGLISRQGLESSFLIISVLVHSSAYGPRKSSPEEKVGSSSSSPPRAQDFPSDNQPPSLKLEPQPNPRIWSSQMNSWPQDSMLNCNREFWTLK